MQGLPQSAHSSWTWFTVWGVWRYQAYTLMFLNFQSQHKGVRFAHTPTLRPSHLPLPLRFLLCAKAIVTDFKWPLMLLRPSSLPASLPRLGRREGRITGSNWNGRGGQKRRGDGWSQEKNSHRGWAGCLAWSGRTPPPACGAGICLTGGTALLQG